MVGLDRFPCFSTAVKNIQPGHAITIDDKANSYPTALSDIERGEYYVQMIIGARSKTLRRLRRHFLNKDGAARGWKPSLFRVYTCS